MLSKIACFSRAARSSQFASGEIDSARLGLSSVSRMPMIKVPPSVLAKATISAARLFLEESEKEL